VWAIVKERKKVLKIYDFRPVGKSRSCRHEEVGGGEGEASVLDHEREKGTICADSRAPPKLKMERRSGEEKKKADVGKWKSLSLLAWEGRVGSLPGTRKEADRREEMEYLDKKRSRIGRGRHLPIVSEEGGAAKKGEWSVRRGDTEWGKRGKGRHLHAASGKNKTTNQYRGGKGLYFFFRPCKNTSF